MKAFIIAVILFFILLFIIIANSVYLHSTCNELNDLLESMTVYDTEKASSFINIWKECRSVFSFSIHEDQLERMDDLSEGLKSAVTENDSAEFKRYKTLLKELLDEFLKNEEISFQSIF